jgi:hypothetical protein
VCEVGEKAFKVEIRREKPKNKYMLYSLITTQVLTQEMNLQLMLASLKSTGAAKCQSGIPLFFRYIRYIKPTILLGLLDNMCYYKKRVA